MPATSKKASASAPAPTKDRFLVALKALQDRAEEVIDRHDNVLTQPALRTLINATGSDVTVLRVAHKQLAEATIDCIQGTGTVEPDQLELLNGVERLLEDHCRLHFKDGRWHYQRQDGAWVPFEDERGELLNIMPVIDPTIAPPKTFPEALEALQRRAAELAPPWEGTQTQHAFHRLAHAGTDPDLVRFAHRLLREAVAEDVEYSGDVDPDQFEILNGLKQLLEHHQQWTFEEGIWKKRHGEIWAAVEGEVSKPDPADLTERTQTAVYAGRYLPGGGKEPGFNFTQHVFDPLREAAAVAFFVNSHCERQQALLTSTEESNVRFAARVIAEKLAIAVHNEHQRPVS